MQVLRVMAGEGEQRRRASTALLYVSSGAPGVPRIQGAHGEQVATLILRRCRTP